MRIRQVVQESEVPFQAPRCPESITDSRDSGELETDERSMEALWLWHVMYIKAHSILTESIYTNVIKFIHIFRSMEAQLRHTGRARAGRQVSD